MFGTDGVRGVANTYISPDLCFKLGRAAGLLILQKGLAPSVVIGRDTRISGSMLGAALASGFAHVGVNVTTLGVFPTGGISYITRTQGFSMGAVISASHNPAPDNGVKFLAHDGRKITEADEAALVAMLEPAYEIPVGEHVGTVLPNPTYTRAYLDFLVGLVPERLDDMTVAIDGAHGAGYELGSEVFSSLGAKVIKTGVHPNGNNINHEVGATHPATIQELTKTSGADFGIAYDGDADRAVFSDPQGRLINGDRLMAIWCDHWKENLEPKAVVGTVMSNGGFASAMERSGISLHRANVGDKYVAAKMDELGGKIGGEQSGHIIFSERGPTGDGLITALEFARVVRRSGRPVTELFDIYQPWPQLLANVQVSDKDAFKNSAEVQQAIVAAESELGGHGRINVRASGTQPMVRVMVEADAYDLRDRVLDQVVAAFEEHIGVEKVKRVDLTHALGD
ncbi:MAG: phosphoglucosamine mutase [Chthonomonas sp.]|nr:phosphoglucosamine mutase [Chthonomonas sp.]